MGATAEGRLPRQLRAAVNDPAGRVRRVASATELVGPDKVVTDMPLIMASEDFSYMLEQVPGCFVNIGNGDVEGSCEVHNPGYDFNDAALPLGAAFFARVIERKLAPA
jgi:metal-dependent amidase/aminoacylase/carboxypeptidase family protein